MSVSERTGVTAEAVRQELAELETDYKKHRKAVLATMATPYQERRKKLTRLLVVLEDEEPAGD